jgi:hypothetical protein
MTTKDELVPLNAWTLSVSEDGKVIDSGAIDDFEEIEAGAEIAVEGDIPQGAALFVYELQPGPADKVVVLSKSEQTFPPGTHVRIPDQGWLTTSLDAPIAVVGCAHEVNDDEWPGLLGGHDGDMKIGGSTSTG